MNAAVELESYLFSAKSSASPSVEDRHTCDTMPENIVISLTANRDLMEVLDKLAGQVKELEEACRARRSL